MRKNEIIFSALLISSAIFRALNQFQRWRNEFISWLPEWVFSWDLNFWIVTTLDAEHVYMGGELVLFGIALYMLGRMIFVDVPLPRWLFITAIIFIYYQVFNLFYHFIFRYPEYWGY